VGNQIVTIAGSRDALPPFNLAVLRMTTDLEHARISLESGELQTFADWPPSTLAVGNPGVYAIWRDEELLYIGMSWRDITITDGARGVFGRLSSHVSGRRSGDQFNVYICDHYVVPDLSEEQRRRLRNGERLLDQLTRSYIADNLSYRVWIAPDGVTARSVEGALRVEGLLGQTPKLNPK
jgi:hypothetical protein